MMLGNRERDLLVDIQCTLPTDPAQLIGMHVPQSGHLECTSGTSNQIDSLSETQEASCNALQLFQLEVKLAL